MIMLGSTLGPLLPFPHLSRNPFSSTLGRGDLLTAFKSSRLHGWRAYMIKILSEFDLKLKPS